MVEFGFALPILAGLIMGVFEVGAYLLLHTKLQHAAVSVADLATRDERISESVVSDLFLAVPQIVAPFELSSSDSVVLSAVGRPGSDPTEILWQRRGAGATTGGTALGAQGAQITDPEGIIIGPDETVVVAELTYNFEPIIFPLFGAETIRKEAYFRPRLGALQTVDP